MKALKPISVKVRNVAFRIPSGCEIPQAVVDHWKANDEIDGLVKDKSITSDVQKSATVTNVNASDHRK